VYFSIMTDWFDFSSYLDADNVSAILSQKNRVQTGVALQEHRERLARELRFVPGSIAVPHQVHGKRIGLALPGQIHADTDGLITNDKEVVLSLQVADCSPVFLYHKPTGTRGLVHAGWRGLAAGIISQTAGLLKSMQIDMEEMQVIIGPTIEMDCYEVGEEVASQFPVDVRHSRANGRYNLDLVAALWEQLKDASVQESNIYRADICTRCDSRCHSYRREGKRAGRMIAFFSEKTSRIDE
jgi:YfiH family protein